jgi:DNA-binding GntR family transcriptional regulator
VLRQEVLTALRTAILANEISAGSRLLEADVAEQMGVSRAPVREAIRHLEQEGLVEIFPHRGAVVVGLPEAEIDAIYELRAVIEGRAIAAAMDVVGETELARLEALIDDMRTAIKAREIETIAEIDLQFHGLIVEWSGLTLLKHIWGSLDGLVRVRSYQALDRPGSTAKYFLKNAAGSHTVLVTALREGDPEAAALLARQHVLEVPTMLAGLDGPRRASSKTTRAAGRGRA